MDTRSN